MYIIDVLVCDIDTNYIIKICANIAPNELSSINRTKIVKAIIKAIT